MSVEITPPLKRSNSTSHSGDTISQQALQSALRYLGYRPRSEAQISDRLARLGHPLSVIQQTLEKLRNLNYVDDRAFARDWVRTRSPTQGSKRIEQELIARGIAPTLIRDVIEEMSAESSEEERASALLEKRFKNIDVDDPKAVSRAVAFLERRGFSEQAIRALLRLPIEE